MRSDIEQQRAAMRAELERLLSCDIVREVFLLPAMFGGTNDPRNVIWLPPICIQEKDQFDAQVREAVEQGEIVHYTATPSYDGPSMVPMQVTLSASGTKLALHHVIEVAPHKTW